MGPGTGMTIPGIHPNSLGKPQNHPSASPRPPRSRHFFVRSDENGPDRDRGAARTFLCAGHRLPRALPVSAHVPPPRARRILPPSTQRTLREQRVCEFATLRPSVSSVNSVAHCPLRQLKRPKICSICKTTARQARKLIVNHRNDLHRQIIFCATPRVVGAQVRRLRLDSAGSKARNQARAP